MTNLQNAISTMKPKMIGATNFTTLKGCEKAIEWSNTMEDWSLIVRGGALRAIKEDQLFKGEFKSWTAYITQRWEMNRRTADRLIKALPIAVQIQEETGIDVVELKEKALRPVTTSKNPAKVTEAIVEKVKATKKAPTTKEVIEIVEKVDGKAEMAVVVSPNFGSMKVNSQIVKIADFVKALKAENGKKAVSNLIEALKS